MFADKVWISSSLIKCFVFVEDGRNLYLCNISDKHKALTKIIKMLMKEMEFKEKKRILESLFMNYSGQLNDHHDQEREMIMKNIDVILDWYNALIKQKEE